MHFSLIRNVGILFFRQESYHVTIHATPGLARVPVTKNAPVSRVWLASVHALRDLTSITVEASSRPASKKRQLLFALRLSVTRELKVAWVLYQLHRCKFISLRSSETKSFNGTSLKSHVFYLMFLGLDSFCHNFDWHQRKMLLR